VHEWFASSDLRPAIFALVACALSFPFAPARAQEFFDSFDDDAIDPQVWSVEFYGSGAQVTVQDQQLEFFFPASASGVEFGVRLVGVFQLRGDFDIRVDFRLLLWPRFNGVRTAIALTDAYDNDYGMERSSLSGTEPLGAQEVYVVDFGPIVLVPTTDVTGSLRLARSGSTQTGYYRAGGEWIPVQTDTAPAQDITIQLHAWSHDDAFANGDVRAAADDFVVMAGQLVWPPVSTHGMTWGAIMSLYR
jgi:hypothetical protein